MTVNMLDLFWIFIILVSLQPVLRQQFADAMRRRKIGAIEQKRGSRVILLVHRQETMRLLGFPLMRYIDVNDAEAVIRAIHMTDPDVPVDLVLHTPGGLVLAAVQIARALRGRKAKTTVFIPHMAMSGGTLIALAGDEIVMCPHSVLGPIDPQLNGMPAASLIHVTQQKPIAEIDDNTLVLADIGRKAMRQIAAVSSELLQNTMPKDKAESVAEKLTGGTWTHDYPITAVEARDLGLKVSLEMPEDILELMALYPQPTRMQSAVEYIPSPRRSEQKQPNVH